MSFLNASDYDIYQSLSESSSVTEDSFSDALTLKDVLEQDFNKFSKNLNICHINAQSIAKHYSDLLDTFSSNLIHMVLVSESFLKPTLPSASYSLPGYILIRNDRLGKECGGVAIYVRSHLSYRILSVSPSQYSASPEFIFLEIDLNGKKLLVGVVYSPPTIDFFDKLEFQLEHLVPDYTHHIIMGDFNTCLLADTPRATRFLSIIRSVNLHVLPSGPTHHNTDTADTLLDLILTSRPDLVAISGQHPAPGFSRHDLIFASYKIRPPKFKPSLVFRRSFARMNVEEVKHDFAQVDWTPLITMDCVDDKVQFLNNKIIEIYDIHAPGRLVRVKHVPAHWVTNDIRMAMSRRDRDFRRYKLCRNEENWARYQSARNRCNQMCRNAKRRFIHNNVTNVAPDQCWKFLHSLGIGKSNSQHVPSIPLNDLNLHFSSTSLLDYSTKAITLSEIANLPPSVSDSFSFSPVDKDDIRKLALSIKSNAIGDDGIDRTMIISVLPELLFPISHIINFSLSLGIFPAAWRKAFVRPLPKISLPTTLQDYRPISILPFLSKILEGVVNRQLSHYLHQQNLFNPLQSGFRPGHSTTTALVKVTDDFRNAMEETKVTVLVLIDFSNAFNAVDPVLLVAILSSLNVTGSALSWFSSYLQGRQQAVRVGQDLSDWRDVSVGVPQGGILSPLLFSIFINLATPNLRSFYHLYADDLQIYSSCHVDDIDNCIDLINQDLDTVQQWSERFGISVNPRKCQALIVGSSRQLSNINYDILAPVYFNGKIIPLSSSAKDLGLVIDSNLNWAPQVAEVCRKVYASLHSLYRFKNFLPVHTKISLTQSLLLPIIDYADVCYLDLSEELLNKLDRLLNTCIRFIFNLRKFDHISEYRSQLKWLPIRQRRNLRILLLLYSILHDPLCPAYLKCKFKFLASTHSRELRSSDNLLLDIPAHRTGFYSSSFAVKAVRLWNNLPVDIRKARSKASFKRLVYSHYLAE